MERIEKTVFISYRRTNFPWAMLVYQSLKQHGYDVFIDFLGIPSGHFETAILENITARAHFLLLLTPSALEGCGGPHDWLRREIETALDSKRNIVSLMLEGFSFRTPAIANQLTGKLAPITQYQALSVPNEYFDAAMERLRSNFLNVPLTAVIHPPSASARLAATEQNAAAAAAPQVQPQELTAQQYFEQAVALSDPDEEIRLNTEAIRLRPDFSEAYNNRALARQAKGDLDGALEDFDEALRLKPDFAMAFNNRGVAHQVNGDIQSALDDHNQAIRLKPEYADAYYNRAIDLIANGDPDNALKDLDEAIRIQPNRVEAYNNRGVVRRSKGDLEGALADYSEAIRLSPIHAVAYYNRSAVYLQNEQHAAAMADLQRYMDLGGRTRSQSQQSLPRLSDSRP